MIILQDAFGLGETTKKGKKRKFAVKDEKSAQNIPKRPKQEKRPALINAPLQEVI